MPNENRPLFDLRIGRRAGVAILVLPWVIVWTLLVHGPKEEKTAADNPHATYEEIKADRK